MEKTGMQNNPEQCWGHKDSCSSRPRKRYCLNMGIMVPLYSQSDCVMNVVVHMKSDRNNCVGPWLLSHLPQLAIIAWIGFKLLDWASQKTSKVSCNLRWTLAVGFWWHCMFTAQRTFPKIRVNHASTHTYILERGIQQITESMFSHWLQHWCLPSISPSEITTCLWLLLHCWGFVLFIESMAIAQDNTIRNWEQLKSNWQR